MSKRKWLLILGMVVILAVSVIGCGVSGKSPTKKSVAPQQSQSQNTASEQPLAPEKNPPGDIPDTQVFVKYSSSQGGYQLKVPEGWACTEHGTNVSFKDKFDGVKVEITKASVQPSSKNVQNKQIAVLKQTEKAVQINSVSNLQLNGGVAVLIAYNSNSAPDPVTNKRVRLENNSYLFYKNGKIATLTVWAPLGADNVDQWKAISNSFRWN